MRALQFGPNKSVAGFPARLVTYPSQAKLSRACGLMLRDCRIREIQANEGNARSAALDVGATLRRAVNGRLQQPGQQRLTPLQAHSTGFCAKRRAATAPFF
jgi:hypothetical protein